MLNCLEKKVSRALNSLSTNLLSRSGSPRHAKPQVGAKILSLPRGHRIGLHPTKYEGEKKNPNCVAVKISIVPTTFPCDSTLLKLSKENYLTFGSGNVSTTYWLLTVSAETVTDPAG